VQGVRRFVCFSIGFGIGLAIGVLAAPHAGVTNRKLLRSRAFGLTRTAARAERLAHRYAGHSATDEGMAEAPPELPKRD
jgi:hypothetical protein